MDARQRQTTGAWVWKGLAPVTTEAPRAGDRSPSLAARSARLPQSGSTSAKDSGGQTRRFHGRREGLSETPNGRPPPTVVVHL
ncbi:hypothetical protein GN956_G25928 [Arapaima gigas]